MPFNAELTRRLRPEAKPKDWRGNCVQQAARDLIILYWKSNYRAKGTVAVERTCYAPSNLDGAIQLLFEKWGNPKGH